MKAITDTGKGKSIDFIFVHSSGVKFVIVHQLYALVYLAVILSQKGGNFQSSNDEDKFGDKLAD